MDTETPMKQEYKRGYDAGFQDGVAAARANTPRVRLLRDVVRSGGKDRRSHLLSHGHHIATVRAAIRHGLLKEPEPHLYEITEIGRAIAAE